MRQLNRLARATEIAVLAEILDLCFGLGAARLKYRADRSGFDDVGSDIQGVM